MVVTGKSVALSELNDPLENSAYPKGFSDQGGQIIYASKLTFLHLFHAYPCRLLFFFYFLPQLLFYHTAIPVPAIFFIEIVFNDLRETPQQTHGTEGGIDAGFTVMAMILLIAL